MPKGKHDSIRGVGRRLRNSNKTNEANVKDQKGVLNPHGNPKSAYSKGQSGNPIGRVPNHVLSEMLLVARDAKLDLVQAWRRTMAENESIVREGSKTQPTFTFLAARVMVEIARTGDPYAYDRMLDRVMGKVPIKINFDEMARTLSDEDLLELIRISVNGIQSAGPVKAVVPASYRELENSECTQGNHDGSDFDPDEEYSPPLCATETGEG